MLREQHCTVLEAVTVGVPAPSCIEMSVITKTARLAGKVAIVTGKTALRPQSLPVDGRMKELALGTVPASQKLSQNKEPK